MIDPIALIAGYTIYPVEPDSTFRDLRLDDVHKAGIAIAIDEAFNCDIPDSEIERWCCVADVVRTVERVRG